MRSGKEHRKQQQQSNRPEPRGVTIQHCRSNSRSIHDQGNGVGRQHTIPGEPSVPPPLSPPPPPPQSAVPLHATSLSSPLTMASPQQEPVLIQQKQQQQQQQGIVHVTTQPAQSNNRISSTLAPSNGGATIAGLAGRLGSAATGVADYPCTYNRLPGRLYLTETQLLFSSSLAAWLGWGNTLASVNNNSNLVGGGVGASGSSSIFMDSKVCLYYHDMRQVDLIRTTSIRIQTVDCETYVFRSFQDREQVLRMIKQCKNLVDNQFTASLAATSNNHYDILSSNTTSGVSSPLPGSNDSNENHHNSLCNLFLLQQDASNRDDGANSSSSVDRTFIDGAGNDLRAMAEYSASQSQSTITPRKSTGSELLLATPINNDLSAQLARPPTSRSSVALTDHGARVASTMASAVSWNMSRSTALGAYAGDDILLPPRLPPQPDGGLDRSYSVGPGAGYSTPVTGPNTTRTPTTTSSSTFPFPSMVSWSANRRRAVSDSVVRVSPNHVAAGHPGDIGKGRGFSFWDANQHEDEAVNDNDDDDEHENDELGQQPQSIPSPPAKEMAHAAWGYSQSTNHEIPTTTSVEPSASSAVLWEDPNMPPAPLVDRLKLAWEKAKQQPGDEDLPLQHTGLQAASLNCALDVFFRLFLADRAPYSFQGYQRDRLGDKDVSLTTWNIESTFAKSATSNSFGSANPNSSDLVAPLTMTRTLKFTRSIKNPLGVGPTAAYTTRQQRLTWYGAYGMILSNKTHVEGIPASDSFYMQDAWIVEAVPTTSMDSPDQQQHGQSPCKILVSTRFDTHFTKRTFLKGAIEKKSRKETKDSYSGYLSMMQEALVLEEQSTTVQQQKHLQESSTTMNGGETATPVSTVGMSPDRCLERHHLDHFNDTATQAVVIHQLQKSIQAMLRLFWLGIIFLAVVMIVLVLQLFWMRQAVMVLTAQLQLQAESIDCSSLQISK